MSMQDPISDMLTRIRNAHAVEKKGVVMPFSKTKQAIAAVLKDEGYILDLEKRDIDGKPWLDITLKYFNDKPVIDSLKRVSRPGLRIYKQASELPKVENGLGVAIVTTSKGVMSAKQAISLGLGGEIMCYVS